MNKATLVDPRKKSSKKKNQIEGKEDKYCNFSNEHAGNVTNYYFLVLKLF